METKKLAVSLPGLELKNPIMPASGTFGFGDVPSANKYSLDTLGALVIKTTTSEARTGNPDHKISVNEDGVLNAVGRTNPGVDVVVSNKLPTIVEKYTELQKIGVVGGE